jgi:anti-anti-sigma regulatory factor/DNA-binding NarL/FixJ family response regulator
MIDAGSQKNRRILMIDDSEEIHEAFRLVLDRQEGASELDALEASLFGASPSASALPAFELTSAYQGEQGLVAVQKALREGAPFAMAFVDLRMPPGWDGVETLSRLWEADPALQAVICSAYADYSWADIIARLGQTHRLLILKKPADPSEIRQMACALTEKWNFEQALLRSEAHNRSLLEALPDALLRVAGDGTCLAFKPSREIPALSPSRAAPPCPLRDLLPDAAVQQVMDRVARAFHDDTAERFELLVAADGEGSASGAERAVEARVARSGPSEALVILRDITERKRAKAEAEQRRAWEETIRAQADALAALSTPLIPISDEIVVVPLIGELTIGRMQQVQETLVQGISAKRARVAILDITGVPRLDAPSADAILRASQATRLLGAEVILTGIRPDVAQTLVGLGHDLGGVVTHRTLQAGIAFAMSRRLGRGTWTKAREDRS